MGTEAAFYFLLAMGAFLTGAGRYILGPAIVVLALLYRQRFVTKDTP